MAFKESRKIKVYEQSGYNYKGVPAIMLKGQWLKELGFEAGNYISVSCENGKLIITPDAERTSFEEAEAIFMKQETKKLQKRFETEKAEITAKFVAEGKVGYGL